MALLVTYPPRDDESGLGYYRRLAADNSFLGWKDLARAANLSTNRTTLMQSREHLSSELGLEPTWMESVGAAEESIRRARGLRRVSVDVICPLCLRDDIYIRQYWEHGFVVACPVHRVILRERCDSCGEMLRDNRDRIEFCHCTQDLRDLQTRGCTEVQLWVSALFASGGASTAGVKPTVSSVDTTTLSDLLRTLCLFYEVSSKPPRRNSASPQTVSAAVEFLSPLDNILENWPTGFERHVAIRIAAGQPEARTLNKLLGQWYAHVRKACESNGCLGQFLDVVIRIAERDFTGTLGLSAEASVAVTAERYLRLSDVMKMTGAGRDQLVEVMKAGRIQHRALKLGTRGQVYEVKTAEVERLKTARDEWLAFEDARSVAHIPKVILESMMESGVVISDKNWRTDVFKGGPVNRKSLEDLHLTLNSSVKAQPTLGHNDLLAWSELTSRRMGDRKAIQEVMRAARDGHLCPVRPSERLGDTQFSKADVANYFGTPVLEAGMSLNQLSKVTGWKWESVAHWVDVGLLGSTSIMLRGQACRVISFQHLLDFKRQYIPLADLAHVLETKSTALRELLSGIEVVGAKTLKDGAQRGALLRICDLGRLAIAGSKASTRSPDR